MSRMAAIVAAIVIVLAVEIVMVMTARVTTHTVPGGVTLFAVLGAVALVRVAKVLGAIGVQRSVADDTDD